MKKALWSAFLLAAGTMAAQNLPAPNTVAVDPKVTMKSQEKTATPSKSDEKHAKHEFSEGMKLKNAGKIEEAYNHFGAAAKLVPNNAEYATAWALTRQQAVMAAIQRGNGAMDRNSTIEAQADYREALRIDPDNPFALQQLKNALPTVSSNTTVRYTDDDDENFASPIYLAPANTVKAFTYRGDSRALMTTVMQGYGVTATIDDSVPTKRVRFDIDATDFSHAVDAACAVTKTFWIPLGLRQVLVMADTAANRREFDRMALRTFYFPDATTPTELQDIVNVFRVIFDVRFVVPQPSRNAITVRAPRETMQVLSQFFDDLDSSRPQVAIDISVYQVSGNFTRQFGLDVPQQFTTFALGPALAQLGSTNIQTLINNLIASGAINQANNTSIQALIAQALGSQASGLFQNPFVTYGGGLTLMALSAPGTTMHLNLNKSDLRSLDHLTMRAAQNSPSTIKIGQRYPITNSTFSPIFNTAAISQVLGNGSFVAPFPSFSYEDLGLTVKATPSIQANRDVRLALEMQIRSLGATTNNGIPIINNQEYKGTISLKDGEAGAVATYLTTSESKALNGVPGLVHIPGLGSSDNEAVQSELLIVLTPHVLRVMTPKLNAIALPRGP